MILDKLNDLIEHLRDYDELTILELLNITTDDLLDQFSELVNENYEEIAEQIGWN